MWALKPTLIDGLADCHASSYKQLKMPVSLDHINRIEVIDALEIIFLTMKFQLIIWICDDNHSSYRYDATHPIGSVKR